MNAETSTSRERRKLPHRCGQDNCPAKWGYIADGFLYCRNGHHQPDFQQVFTQETERFNASQGQIVRAQRERAASATASRVIPGRSSYYIYLACYQQILQTQCQTLIKSKGFPASFEQCVKDLWALRLPRVQEHFGSKLAHGLSGDSAERQEEDDAASEALYSSQPQLSDDASIKGSGRSQNRQIPNISESLALLYIAAMLLRIPLSTATLGSWCTQNSRLYEFAYLEVPAGIMENLETRYQRLLQSKSALQPDDLHLEIRKLTIVYSDELRVLIPPLNYRPLLFFHIQSLGLPLQLYSTVQYLVALLGLDFSFPIRTQSRKNMTQSPETQLIAALVVATKLHYPFPPTPPTYARSSTDPFFLNFSWETWSKLEAERNNQESQSASFHTGKEANVTEVDILDFTPQQMDSYMDWYTQTFVENKGQRKRTVYSRSKLSEQLVNMFPLPDESPANHHGKDSDDLMRIDGAASKEAIYGLVKDLARNIATLTEASQEREIMSERDNGKSQGAGSYYQAFADSSGLQGIAFEFHKRAAAQCANSIDTLLQAAQDLEYKIRRARRAWRSQSNVDN